MAKKKSKSTKRKRKKKSADAAKKQLSISVDMKDLAEPQESSPPIWVDRMHVQARDEGLMTLIFESAIPDRKLRIEACRLTMTADLAKKIAEVLMGQVVNLQLLHKSQREA